MKRIVKILTIFVIVSIFLFLENYVLAETQMKVKATLNTSQINSGDEVSINLAIEDFKEIGEGINAYVFTLNFNTEEFEFVKVEGQNGWNTPAYNEKALTDGKVKFAATRSTFLKEKSNMLKIVLKAKRSFTSNIPDISMTDMSFAAKIDGKTSKLQMSDLKLQSMESGKVEPDKQLEEKEPTEAKSPLPAAGKQVLGTLIILLIVINVFVFYYKYRKLDKYVK